MKNTMHLRNAVVAGLFIVFGGAFAAEAAQNSAGDELLQILPAESLFVVRINNYDYTISQIDQFMAGASPMPMGATMLLRMQLAGLLGDPALSGVNTGGSFALFAIAENDESASMPKVHIAGVLPISDFDEFVAGNSNCSQADAAGICRITTTSMAGASATLVIAPVGNFAVIAPEDFYDRLAAIVKSSSRSQAASLAGTLDTAQVEQATEQPIWVYGNIVQVNESFGAALSAQIEQFKGMFQMMSARQGQPAPSPELMDAYACLIETMIKEVKSVSMTVRVDPGALHMTKTITAVPGTETANMLTGGTLTGKNELLGYLEDGAVMNCACRMDSPFWQRLNERGIDLMAKVAGQSMSEEDLAKMKTLLVDMLDSVGQSLVFSLSVDSAEKPPFVGRYAFDVKDVDKFNRVIDESAELMMNGSYSDLYKNLGMNYAFDLTRGADSYKNVSIDSARLTIKSTEPDSPQGQMMDQMYGDGIKYQWAVVDDLWVCGIGGDDTRVRQMIDQRRGDRPKEICSEVKAALALLPNAETADFVGTYNYVRLLKILPAMMPVPIMPQIDVASSSNIAFAGSIADEKAVIDIALPKQHLTEVVSAFMMIAQQMQQMTAQQMQQATSQTQTMIQPPEMTGAMPHSTSARVSGLLVEAPIDIEGLAFGMTVGQMEQVLGPPQSQTGGAYYYFNSGFAVLTATDGSIDAIICGSSASPDSVLTANCKYRTKKNIGMGSAKDEVVGAYGTPSSVNKLLVGNDSMILEYDNLNARFTLMGGHVVHMVFRKPMHK